MIQDVRNALDVLEGQHKREIDKLNKGLEARTLQMRETQMALDASKEKAEKYRQEANRAKDKLKSREAKLAETRADSASAIATLEAEKEILALRDREARDELDRLRMQKK